MPALTFPFVFLTSGFVGICALPVAKVVARGGIFYLDRFATAQDAEEALYQEASANRLVHQRQVGEWSMTNIEKLARLIVKTGRADQIMGALEITFKVEIQSDDVGSEGSQLCVSQVRAGSDPAGLHQQAG